MSQPIVWLPYGAAYAVYGVKGHIAIVVHQYGTRWHITAWDEHGPDESYMLVTSDTEHGYSTSDGAKRRAKRWINSLD